VTCHVYIRRLVEYLSGSSNYVGLRRRSNRVPFSHNLDFVKDHPVKTLRAMESDHEIGTFIVNARMVDIVHIDPWWYPICECYDLFAKYIGAFHYTKCYAKKLIVAPKYVLVEMSWSHSFDIQYWCKCSTLFTLSHLYFM
jgi:hypothetical protein